MASDVSKYLAFANRNNCDWSVLADIDKLKEFVTLLENGGIGPDGMVTKIDRLLTAINYVQRGKITNIPDDLQQRVELWKSSFKREKKKKA